MKSSLALLSAFVLLALPLTAQTANSASPVVPPLLHFSGIATDESGNALTGQTKITFALYATQKSGEPLWTETQKIELSATGSYDVQLGATKKAGVPSTLF